MFKLFEKFRKKLPVTIPLSNINALIREGRNLYSDELIVIDEKISVNLFCAEKVDIEKNGLLYGNISSKTCVINGVVHGEVFATYKLEIKSSARIRGNIKSPILNIEPGAVINGRIAIAEDKNKAFELSEKINKFPAADYLNAKSAVELPVNKLPDVIIDDKRIPDTLAQQPNKPTHNIEVEFKAGMEGAPVMPEQAAEVQKPPAVIELKAAKPLEIVGSMNGHGSYAPVEKTKAATPSETIILNGEADRNEEKPTEVTSPNSPEKETKPSPEENVNRWW